VESQQRRSPGGPALIYESNDETFKLFGYSIGEMRRYLESIDYQTFRYEEGRLLYCAPDDLQPELWLDVVALGPARREALAAHIDPGWERAKLVERCLFWGGLEHDNVKHYLARELAARPELVAVSPALRDLQQRLPGDPAN